MVEEVNPFKAKQLEEKRRRDAAKQQDDAEAERLAKEKALQKKKQQRAVEDEWFYDGEDSPGAVEMDHADDVGFQMFDVSETAPAPEKKIDRLVTVKSLIDFDECNVADDPSDLQEIAEPLDSVDYNPQEVSSAFSGVGGSQSELHLLSEIENLQQRLRDAEEEKKIQLLMAQDEVSHGREELRSVTLERDSLRLELELARSQAQSTASAPPAAAPVAPAAAHSGVIALEALRDVRMQAERQVEWIRNTLRLSEKGATNAP
jgi:hypothetical protein